MREIPSIDPKEHKRRWELKSGLFLKKKEISIIEPVAQTAVTLDADNDDENKIDLQKQREYNNKENELFMDENSQFKLP